MSNKAVCHHSGSFFEIFFKKMSRCASSKLGKRAEREKVRNAEEELETHKVKKKGKTGKDD